MVKAEKKWYVGLDLGTSSVKCLALSPEGKTVGKKVSYREISLKGWKDAAAEVLSALTAEIGGKNIAALGLSSQVGTYIIGDKIIGWNESAGREELKKIKSEISKEEFLTEISMAHPAIISYPLPRLCYIRNYIAGSGRVIMPKEILTEFLCGEIYSDSFSWRGLYNFGKGQLSYSLLRRLGLDFDLPEILRPTDRTGRVTGEAAERTGLSEGTPVIVGCNDFFAGLLGMGITGPGALFDLSGTSEHVGTVGEKLVDTDMVSGPYFKGFCTYGGTKSSGTCCDFAIGNFSLQGMEATCDYHEILDKKPPLFLPYLAGERAPIFNENARGVFFGLSAETGKREMAYAVLEGVVFSLYDIFLRIDGPHACRQEAPLVTGGGSAGNLFMARLKAELFGRRVTLTREKDSSAMGAALLASVGDGFYNSPEEAAEAAVISDSIAEPMDERLGERLRERFALYRSLYGSLREDFESFSRLS